MNQYNMLFSPHESSILIKILICIAIITVLCIIFIIFSNIKSNDKSLFVKDRNRFEKYGRVRYFITSVSILILAALSIVFITSNTSKSNEYDFHFQDDYSGKTFSGVPVIQGYRDHIGGIYTISPGYNSYSNYIDFSEPFKSQLSQNLTPVLIHDSRGRVTNVKMFYRISSSDNGTKITGYEIGKLVYKNRKPVSIKYTTRFGKYYGTMLKETDKIFKDYGNKNPRRYDSVTTDLKTFQRNIVSIKTTIEPAYRVKYHITVSDKNVTNKRAHDINVTPDTNLK